MLAVPVTAVLLLSTGQALASQPRVPQVKTRLVGRLHINIAGLPASVPADHVVRFHLNISQTSRYYVDTCDVVISIWSHADPAGFTVRDARLSYKDRLTKGKWRRPWDVDPVGDYHFGPRHCGLIVPPRGGRHPVVRVYVKAVFSPKVVGVPLLLFAAIGGWTVEASSRHSVPDLNYNWITHSLQVTR